MKDYMKTGKNMEKGNSVGLILHYIKDNFKIIIFMVLVLFLNKYC
jgi:hypothetical protein